MEKKTKAEHPKPRKRGHSKALDQNLNYAWLEYRKKQLAAIHVWKVQLKLDDAVYRQMLVDQAGVNSAKDLDRAGIDTVVDWFQSQGCRYPASRKYSPKTRDQQGTKTQVDKIRALWIELYRLGIVRDRSEEALCKFCQRFTQVQRVEWLNDKPQLCNRVIEALKAMAKRAGHEF